MSRITAEDYRTKKDIRDDLDPSTLTTVKLNGRYRYTRNLQLNGDLSSATRSADGLRSNEVSAGLLYTGYLRKRLSLGFKYGIRKAFLSDDTFIVLQASYFQRNWNLFSSYIIQTEKYATGNELNPNTLNVEFAFFLSDDFRGAASFTKSDAQDRSLTSFMLMIGYQIGSESASPTRRRVPDFEDI